MSSQVLVFCDGPVSPSGLVYWTYSHLFIAACCKETWNSVRAGAGSSVTSLSHFLAGSSHASTDTFRPYCWECKFGTNGFWVWPFDYSLWPGESYLNRSFFWKAKAAMTCAPWSLLTSVVSAILYCIVLYCIFWLVSSWLKVAGRQKAQCNSL